MSIIVADANVAVRSKNTIMLTRKCVVKSDDDRASSVNCEFSANFWSQQQRQHRWHRDVAMDDAHQRRQHFWTSRGKSCVAGDGRTAEQLLFIFLSIQQVNPLSIPSKSRWIDKKIDDELEREKITQINRLFATLTSPFLSPLNSELTLECCKLHRLCETIICVASFNKNNDAQFMKKTM